MNKRTLRITIVIWLILLTMCIVRDNQRLRWLEAQYDNVINVLIER